MAEKVAKLGISRDKDYMLYVKDGAVWRVRRKQPGLPKGKPEKVADGGFEMDNNYIYFVDKDGDVSRAKRAVGGQKRKKSAEHPFAIAHETNLDRVAKTHALRVELDLYRSRLAWLRVEFDVGEA